jgi:hypothetical protein
MMAVRYSGQYAAAQLDKLPLPPSLQLEVAAYVGHHDLDLLLPPTYRPLARMLGRMPTAHTPRITEHRIKVFDYELPHDYPDEVTASCVTRSPFGDRLDSVIRTGTLAEIRSFNWSRLMLYNAYIFPEYTPDDAVFFRTWEEKYGDRWPGRVGAARYIHQGLWKAYGKFSNFEDDYRTHGSSVSTIINRYNYALNVHRSFNSNDGTVETDSD